MTPFDVLGLTADSQMSDDDVRVAWCRIVRQPMAEPAAVRLQSDEHGMRAG
jgi:hypothetical protein